MRRLLVSLLCLGLIAADPPEAPVEVRPVTESSVQPFEVLMELRRARELREPRARARAYQSVLGFDPALVEARLGLGRALVDLGELDAAHAALQGAGGSVEAHTLRLVVAVERGERDDADVVLPNRFAHYPDPRLMNTLGRWLDERGRDAEARNAFRRADALQRPGLADANVGASYFRAGDLDSAQAAYRRAVSRDPSDPGFRRGYRLSLLADGNYEGALAGATGAEADAVLRAGAARALRSGEVRLARLMLERAVALSPRHDPALAALLQQLDEEARHKAEHAQ